MTTQADGNLKPPENLKDTEARLKELAQMILQVLQLATSSENLNGMDKAEAERQIQMLNDGDKSAFDMRCQLEDMAERRMKGLRARLLKEQPDALVLPLDDVVAALQASGWVPSESSIILMALEHIRTIDKQRDDIWAAIVQIRLHVGLPFHAWPGHDRFGEVLRQMRLLASLSQAQIGSALGLSAVYVSHLENHRRGRKPTQEQISGWAAACGRGYHIEFPSLLASIQNVMRADSCHDDVDDFIGLLRDKVSRQTPEARAPLLAALGALVAGFPM